MLILILLAVVVYVAYLLMNNPYVKKTAEASIQPAPLSVVDPMSSGGIDLKKNLIKTNETVGDFKTTETEQFKAEYLIMNKRFIVTIKKSPYSVSKKAAEDWFTAQGFSGGDLCAPNISFVPGIGVKDKITPADSVFKGCPVPNL